MQLVDRTSKLWEYLSEELRGLIQDGEVLLDHADANRNIISDYSYLVFPFSKAYEGFLKMFYLDLNLIREDEYFSDDIRIGRILNPDYIRDNEHIYKNSCLLRNGGSSLSARLWNIWKKGRNRVFHYFPHNFRKLNYEEALEIINELINAMTEAVGRCTKH